MGAGIFFRKMRTLPMLSLFTDIETLHWAMVSHYPSVNQAFTAFLLILLQNQVMLLCIHHYLLNFGELLKSGHRISDSTRARH